MLGGRFGGESVANSSILRKLTNRWSHPFASLSSTPYIFPSRIPLFPSPFPHNNFSTSGPSVPRSRLSPPSFHDSSPSPSSHRSLDSPKMSVRFSVEDSPGALHDALSHFWKHGISLSRLESRPNKRNSDYDFYVDFLGDSADDRVRKLLADLRRNARDVQVLESRRVAWFPKKIRDLDHIANQILDAGAELQADHPGFTDKVYRERRRELAQVAIEYRQGQPIPVVKYRKEEVSTWSTIYDKLMPLLEKHACNEYMRMLPLLVENCGYRRDNIPQAQDISDFLKECTGFTLRPVAGLLSARNFLYGLAFRVFFSTQYIRHDSRPLYTPEPDLVHELMGHAPLFADQNFADFSQEIGLAAIGATDEQILQLARCYWFSVEFGLCLQHGERKAYGAGLLSSFGELEYSMSNKPEIRPFDPFKAALQDYPITTYQPVYFAATSFEEAKMSMQRFSNSFSRPFNVRYNPYTQSLEVDGNISLESIEAKEKPKTAKEAYQS